jgi:hypothetical protein
MERVPCPSIARRQFDFGDFSQESQETVSVTHLSVLGKTTELPVPVGAFMDRQAMLEYQNGETQEFPLSPILLSTLCSGNCSHVMSCDITTAGQGIFPVNLQHKPPGKATAPNSMMRIPAEVRPTRQKQSPRKIQQSQRKRQKTQRPQTWCLTFLLTFVGI